ncbi:unnamed protein product [Meganyctiphanes norvegica]|uniref:C-type lectin domain-containing protein n=1 Tax=Meganyctiphanes norvegica TaxID=48144 RepID=A0AAV2SBR3_MEGNR
MCSTPAIEPPLCSVFGTSRCQEDLVKEQCPTMCGAAAIVGCPVSQGFFNLPGKNKCYKHLHDKFRTGDEARSTCKSEGLELARVEDGIAIALRKYITQNIKSDSGTFIGGRGDWTSTVRWERDQVPVETNNPLWAPGNPAGYTSRDHCMFLKTWGLDLLANPDRPYGSYDCSHSFYALCEVVRERTTFDERIGG